MNRIPSVQFHQKRELPKGIEVLTLDNLRSRPRQKDHDPAQHYKLKFNLLYFVKDGEGTHTIDFRNVQLNRGSLILIREGQVHQFSNSDTNSGFLILFTTEFLRKNLLLGELHILSILYDQIKQNLPKVPGLP